MTAPSGGLSPAVEQQIGEWRTFLRRRQAIHAVDVAELEDHLREQVAALVKAGLKDDEAFLVAVRRMGALDALSREFAQEHSERLWKQLVVVQPDAAESTGAARSDWIVAWLFAVAAGALVKLPGLFGVDMDSNEVFYARNMSFFVLPLLTGYFAWKRRLAAATVRWLIAAFAAGLVVANLYPLGPKSATLPLTIMHLPMALWLAVGIAYAGGRWRRVEGRMDFIRFSGELFIYYVLIALGGGVLTGLLLGLFKMIGVDAEPFVQSWLIPCGAAGAVLVASWLVEAKQGVIENMAPVLTRLFTPLFALLLLTFLVALLVQGGMTFQREMLIVFDLLLVLVVALVLYSLSAREPGAAPGAFDVLQVVLIVSALLADLVALWAIAARISEFGFTPNRVAALGENIILMINLAWSAVLYVRFLKRRDSLVPLERWQTSLLPVYAGWAAIVVIVFPPLFRYV